MVLGCVLFGAALLLLSAPETAALVLVLGALSWLIIVRFRAHGPWLALPALYVAVTAGLGIISYNALVDTLGRSSFDTTSRVFAYAGTLLGMLIAVLLLPFRGPGSTAGEGSVRPSSPGNDGFVLRVVWIVASVIGMLGAGMLLSQLSLSSLLEDPLASRQGIQGAGASPVAWIAFRMLIVAAAAATALVCVSGSSGKLALKLCAVNAPYIVLLSAYGGRLMPVLVVVDAVLLYWYFVRAPRPAPLVFAGLATYILTTLYATYRYFHFFGRDVTWHRFKLTILSQNAGELSDAQRMASIFQDNPEIPRDILVAQLLDSLPDSLVKLVGIPTYHGAKSFGLFASESLGEAHVGGIRIGAVGEVSLSFGLAGSLVLGLLVGLLMWISYKLLSGGYAVLAVLLVTQVAGALLLGAASFVGVISLLAASSVLFLFGQSREAGAAERARTSEPARQ